ncbi:MAG: hypothetical protein U5M53_13250 [Rhodoferax sp.]|nr:hypothetical protein [Rhodoferax sp.]
MKLPKMLKVSVLTVALLLAACSSGPVAPAWQVDAKDAMDRANAAYMEGDSRVASAEMARVRKLISGTGRADLLATAELAHCAAHVASLVLEPCAGFEALRTDATATQIAYAGYLQGNGPAPAKPNADDPLSRLLVAAIAMQKGQASPATIAGAIETASAQGWRRPLLAWLGVQALRAEQGGDASEAQRIRRRMALVEGRK